MRRLTRYSIRSLLVLTTLTCVVLGWYVGNRSLSDREAEAIEVLSELVPMGYIATVEEDGVLFCGTGVVGTADIRVVRPRWLSRWLHARGDRLFGRVVKISFGESVDDRVIPYLARLKSLEEIHFSDSCLSDEGKAQLRALFPDATIEFETQPEPDPDDPFG